MDRSTVTIMYMNPERDGGPEQAPGGTPGRRLRAHREILAPRLRRKISPLDRWEPVA
ncbi:hypothetical protein GCM10010387_49880 [Streptomyces inusitatus]|uniref:Uncharacterized protein n=1 Tax=Streptomyces inusitatus TaxID=68221 RepID=A0A918QJH4_9ACTN|nr:hypothetical protein [Streptomyces inusitatus]GGZ49636.1 hypothetical protein GCM10010387_49880 [Streptomyces inusitatus]